MSAVDRYRHRDDGESPPEAAAPHTAGPGQRRRSWILRALFLLCLFACSSCRGPTGDASQPAAPHTVTSATPGLAAVQLAADHPGWAGPGCRGCHALAHGGDLADGTCAACHGTNGARRLPAGHAHSGCITCHEGAHRAEARFLPADCTACHRFVPGPVDTCSHTAHYDVVVIGAGGGGLAAAAVLASAGRNVLLLEKHFQVGGQMRGFSRGEYWFEGSLLAFDIMGLMALQHPGLGLSGHLQTVTMRPTMYRAAFPGIIYDVPARAESYREYLKQAFPHEAAGLDRLFPVMKSLVMSLFYMNLTFPEVMARHGIEDPELIALFTRLGSFFALEPAEVPASLFMGLWFGYHMGGFHYFVGGSQAIVDALADTVVRHGGTIKLNTLATEIRIENGLATQVRTQDGGCFSTDYVISNAPAPTTFQELIGPAHLPEDFLREISETPLGLSAIHVYLGVDRDYSEYFHGSHALFVSDTWDPSHAFAAITECDPELTELILCNFSVADPTAAPPGKNVIALATQLDYGCYNEWFHRDSLKRYKANRQAVAMALVRRAERFLPGLADHIEVMEIATPITIERFTLAPRGSILGWQLTQENFFDLGRVNTPIPNVFLAGAWTRGGGQSNAIISGILAADRIPIP